MAYTIVSFNVLKMGESAVSQQSRKDWDTIARMLSDIRPDVIALQEVLKKEPVAEFVRRLSGYGGEWDFRFEQKDTVRNNREGYAFIWNTRTMGLLSVNGTIKEPHIEAKWSRSLIRPPYVGRFIPVALGSPHVEFRLINTHVVFGEDVYSEDHGNDLSDKAMRMAEYSKLIGNVFPDVVNVHDGNFRTPYTFILGDYNLSYADCFALNESLGDPKRFMLSGQRARTTISRSKAETPGEDAYANDYDHFTSSDHEDEYIQDSAVIDGPRRYYAQSGVPDFKTYVERVSDHIPMLFHLDLTRSRSPFVQI